MHIQITLYNGTTADYDSLYGIQLYMNSTLEQVEKIYIVDKKKDDNHNKIICVEIGFPIIETQIISLYNLPKNLKYLYVSSVHIDKIDIFPDRLQTLRLCNCNLKSIPPLPDTLIELYLFANKNLTSLPPLPNSLKELDCAHNDLSSLPQLPNSLNIINVSYNKLTVLPQIPKNVTELQCCSNKLTVLPQIPKNVTELQCCNNMLTILPELPDKITTIRCSRNNLTKLPELPEQLYGLHCGSNNLTKLPILPENLNWIHCSHNYKLKYLPGIPKSLKNLNCFRCGLMELPEEILQIEYVNYDTKLNFIDENPVTLLIYRVFKK